MQRNLLLNHDIHEAANMNAYYTSVRKHMIFQILPSSFPFPLCIAVQQILY